MAKTHDEIREIIRKAKDENEARINIYKWGIDRGYAKSDNLAKERFLTNALLEPLDEIYANPNILWGRDEDKYDFQYKIGDRTASNKSRGDNENKDVIERLVAKKFHHILTFDEWKTRYARDHKDPLFYDICAYVSSVFGSDVFNVFLQRARLQDIPNFAIIHNPGFIAGHTEQFIKENEQGLSEGEKNIFRILKELCNKYKLPFPELPLEDSDDELWTAIENDESEVCGWLCINKKTKKSYIVKIF